MTDPMYCLPKMDAWAARALAKDTDWGDYLNRRLGVVDHAPDLSDPDFRLWQRYMLRDCLQFVSAVATKLRLPVGRLMKGGQLAHAFVILPNRDGVPDRYPCLDWSGVRHLRTMRADMRKAWGRLTFDDDLSPARSSASILRNARSRPHVIEALQVRWPSVTPSSHGRLRYRDVIDVRSRPARLRDVIDIYGRTPL